MSHHFDKKYGVHSFECDVCGDSEESEEATFQEAWDEISKTDGWKYRNGRHVCESCAQEIGI